jgi:hypothetical protein
MPRTLQEILDHADELADRFEAYEPTDDDRVSTAKINARRLAQAAVARAQAERQVAEAVTAARADGVSWRRIGESLGTSAQATQKRYAARTGKVKASKAGRDYTAAAAQATRAAAAARTGKADARAAKSEARAAKADARTTKTTRGRAATSRTNATRRTRTR